MSSGLRQAITVVRLIVSAQRTRRVFLFSAIAYLLLYLVAVGDLGVHGWQGEVSIRFSEQPLALLFRQMSPFHFEAIAVVRVLFVTYLLSPLNLLLGLLLSALVGLNLALSYVAMVQPKVCHGHPALGLLASLPALVAGSACCGPVVLIALGIQVSALLIAFFGALVPLAVVLLVGTLLLNARRTRVDQLQELGRRSR